MSSEPILDATNDLASLTAPENPALASDPPITIFNE